ncbi:MAG: hypothetical protein ACXWUH_08380, partial [Burkholderiales bacterium]
MKASIPGFTLVLALLLHSSSWAGTYDDLLHAIELDDHRAVAELLKRGADPNTVAPRGDSLLMLAARSGKPGVVKTILSFKPN